MRVSEPSDDNEPTFKSNASELLERLQAYRMEDEDGSAVIDVGMLASDFVALLKIEGFQIEQVVENMRAQWEMTTIARIGPDKRELN